MLKHKKLFIVFLTFLILFYFCTSCFAVNHDFVSDSGVSCSYPQEIIEYMENNYKDIWNDSSVSWICWYWGSVYHLHGLVLNSDSVVCYNHESGVIGVSKKGGSSDTITIKYMVDFNQNYQFMGFSDSATTFSDWSTSRLTSGMTPGAVYFKNTNVYTDVNGEDFFLGVPFPMIVRMSGMEQTTKQILLILPLILVILVSLVGLRKGLKLLSMLLRRCLMR